MPKILAVDDEKQMTALYEALFTDAGYEVVTAEDANSARARLSEFTPDLAVLDAEMPGGGGERIFRLIRARAQVPVIFVTGKPERVLDFALLQTKVRVFAKPVNNDALLAAAEEFCGPVR